MSNLLPATRQRVWMVDAKGSAVEQKAPPKKLTSGQRHYMYRLGLMAVDKFLLEHGFVANSEHSSTSFSYEKGNNERNRVWIDVKLTEPANVAYVTSYPGYEYKPEVIGKTADGQERYGVKAKVVTAKDILGCDLLIKLMVSTQDGHGTRTPIFIPLPKDLDDPARHVLRQVLGMIALSCDTIPQMKAAFTEEKVKAAQNQEIDTSTIPLLPE